MNNKHHKYILALGFLILWHITSLFYSPIILPSPILVLKALQRIITTEAFVQDISLTLYRGIWGYFLGLLLGIFLGVLMGKNNVFYSYCYPIILALQAIPRISWILLAMIWFPLNSSVVIFIILMTILPTITMNVFEGMGTISKELLEMGNIFKVATGYILKDIYLPSILPFVLSAAKIASGLTWKSILMAELLTVNSGIGYGMAYSRAALATDEIIAYTIIILLISFLHQSLLKCISIKTQRSSKQFNYLSFVETKE